jgi:hypothetical protein
VFGAAVGPEILGRRRGGRGIGQPLDALPVD